jgi:hypothetical protein
VHERAAEGFEELVTIKTPRTVLGDLARAARDDVLVAFAAALGVVDRADAVIDRLDLFENEAVVVERAQRDDGILG